MSNSEKYREYRELITKYEYAINIVSFDCETICPKLDREYSMSVTDYLGRKVIEICNSDEYYNLLGDLIKDHEDLNDVEILAVKKEYKEINKSRKIPNDMHFKELMIQSKCSLSWQEARETLEFSEFEDNLGLLVDLNREKIKLLEDKYHGYDVLLDSMEDDFTTSAYDLLFKKLEDEILPLVKKILSLPKRYNTSIRNLKFPIDKQKKLTELICKRMGFDNTNGYIGETIHPFTMGINSNDVRTTTSYDENLLFSNLYSVMHEVGHALYELQVDKRYDNTVLSALTSMGIHESQSRFYENYLGKSHEFIEFIYPSLVELFPQLKEYSVDDIYYYVNDVEAQPRRTEADELTYPFHVLIRYKVEKMLFNGEIEVKDIEKTFDHLMLDYLGIIPSDKKVGCYQDVHWCSGFGYFPTYALGSAISAMVYHYMAHDIDILGEMKIGRFDLINEWLKNHIHKYGMSKKNKEIIRLAFGEDFNPNYYIEYLKNKFKSIYNL